MFVKYSGLADINRIFHAFNYLSGSAVDSLCIHIHVDGVIRTSEQALYIDCQTATEIMYSFGICLVPGGSLQQQQ